MSESESNSSSPSSATSDAPKITGDTQLWRLWARYWWAALTVLLGVVLLLWRARLLIEAFVAGASGILVLFWWLPKSQVAKSEGVSQKNRFNRENEARKTLSQIVGGILLLTGLYSSVRTFELLQQTENIQQQTERVQQQAELRQLDGQIAERYSKAIEQWGAIQVGSRPGRGGKPKINLEVRLGGIYALERIAHDSDKDRPRIIEMLAAYVRANAPLKKDRVRRGKSALLNRQVGADIDAILAVLGGRNVIHGSQNSQIDLHDTDLEGANLAGANLAGTNLKGAHLHGANLQKAILISANLNSADLEDANLKSAYLEGSCVYLTHIYHANLEGAHLHGTDFYDALFNEITLTQEQTDDIRGNLSITHSYGVKKIDCKSQ